MGAVSGRTQIFRYVPKPGQEWHVPLELPAPLVHVVLAGQAFLPATALYSTFLQLKSQKDNRYLVRSYERTRTSSEVPLHKGPFCLQIFRSS